MAQKTTVTVRLVRLEFGRQGEALSQYDDAQGEYNDNTTLTAVQWPHPTI